MSFQKKNKNNFIGYILRDSKTNRLSCVGI